MHRELGQIEEAAHDHEIAAIALPTGPPLPPGVGGAAEARIAVVVRVAAEPVDGPIKPVQAVAAVAVCVQRRDEKTADLFEQRWTPLRHHALRVQQRLEM